MLIRDPLLCNPPNAKLEKLCSNGYSLEEKSASLPYSLEVSCK